MPRAGPPLEPERPYPLNPDETAAIKDAVRRFFGDDVVVRNCGSDWNFVQLHVECGDFPEQWARDDCLGEIFMKVDRPHISLIFTKRGQRIRGMEKIAYRQGKIL